MTDRLLPLLVEADELETHLSEDKDENELVIVDVSSAKTYAQAHIPGALHLEYADIIGKQPPVMGLLPDAASISHTLSKLGITAESHVVAYDEEGGGCASRLLWTLEAYGHTRYSLLNGGLHAWAREHHALEQDIRPVTPTQYEVTYIGNNVASKNDILMHLNDEHVALLDCRSPQEFSGEKKFAERAGHIPGAINLEWTQNMDKANHLRFIPDEELRTQFAALGITPDKEIITYCQTHHRSAHTWFALKYLGDKYSGYKDIKGYPGSWSDWGNDPKMPTE